MDVSVVRIEMSGMGHRRSEALWNAQWFCIIYQFTGFLSFHLDAEIGLWWRTKDLLIESSFIS